ncbi:hypothetical protein T484DRAFT_1859502, partial [Baffinella frigidus]
MRTRYTTRVDADSLHHAWIQWHIIITEHRTFSSSILLAWREACRTRALRRRKTGLLQGRVALSLLRRARAAWRVAFSAAAAHMEAVAVLSRLGATHTLRASWRTWEEERAARSHMAACAVRLTSRTRRSLLGISLAAWARSVTLRARITTLTSRTRRTALSTALERLTLAHAMARERNRQVARGAAWEGRARRREVAGVLAAWAHAARYGGRAR